MTQWTQDIQLSPQQQQALDSQMAIQNARSGAAQMLLPGALANLGTFNYGVGEQVANRLPRIIDGQQPQPKPPEQPEVTPSMQGVFNGAVPWATGVAPTTPAPYGVNMYSGQPIPNPYGSGGAVFGGAPPVAAPAPSPRAPDVNTWRAAAQGAALGFQQPIQIQRQQQLESQLSNMGVTRGSAAWRNEMRNLQDQAARENLLAFGAGQQEASLMFGQGLQSTALNSSLQQQAFQQGLQSQSFQNTVRQQQIAEALQGRTQGINEINALLSGSQIGMPSGLGGASQAGRAQGVDYMGVAQNQYAADANAANIANQARASNTQAGLGLASTAALMFMFSDARLKQDIRPLFTLPNGVEICSYRFIGSDKYELGVIAQQVQSIMPEAVAVDANGILKVDYNKVLT